ncbi:MAG TPA: preprotein translocase subunit SecG [Candidatus Acidoferrum sp.]|nr:preprotein translocase subunit SecG [Candidatus Acidoferrum sp.]
MPSWMKWTFALLVGFLIIAAGFRWSGALLKLFFVLDSAVLMVVVLLQSGKAADLAGAFGGAGSQTAFGPRGAASALSKTTTWCAVMFMIGAFAMDLRTDKALEQNGSVLQEISQPAPARAPANPPPVSPKPASQTTPPASNSTPSTSQPSPAQPKKP